MGPEDSAITQTDRSYTKQQNKFYLNEKVPQSTYICIRHNFLFTVIITNNNNYTYIDTYKQYVYAVYLALGFGGRSVGNVGRAEAGCQFAVGGRTVVIDGARSLDAAHRLLGCARHFHLGGSDFLVVGSVRPCRTLLLPVLQSLHKHPHTHALHTHILYIIRCVVCVCVSYICV